MTDTPESLLAGKYDMLLNAMRITFNHQHAPQGCQPMSQRAVRQIYASPKSPNLKASRTRHRSGRGRRHAEIAQRVVQINGRR